MEEEEEEKESGRESEGRLSQEKTFPWLKHRRFDVACNKLDDVKRQNVLIFSHAVHEITFFLKQNNKTVYRNNHKLCTSTKTLISR